MVDASYEVDINVNNNQVKGISYLSTITTGPASYIDMNSGLDFRNSQKIIQLPNPVNAQDAATMAYVAIPTGTYYWSCPGCNFVSISNTEYVEYELVSGKLYIITMAGTAVLAPVFLPHGAVVTAAIVYGNAGAEDEDWTLRRTRFSDGVTTAMATAAINTEDNTISGATIDNSVWGYCFSTTSMSQNDEIWGARITYTI